MPATLSASWNSDITPIHTGTIICRFATDTDGTLFADSTNSLRCEIRQTSLQFSVAIDGDVPIILDMEDALGLTTGTPPYGPFHFWRLRHPRISRWIPVLRMRLQSLPYTHC